MYEQDIKINADVIWSVLSTNGSMTIGELEELTGFNEKFIFMALGWLAKDKKICFIEKNELLFVEPKQINFSEMYF